MVAVVVLIPRIKTIILKVARSEMGTSPVKYFKFLPFLRTKGARRRDAIRNLKNTKLKGGIPKSPILVTAAVAPPKRAPRKIAEKAFCRSVIWVFICLFFYLKITAG